MTRSFIYARVSTANQTTDNQLQEIAAAGFVVEPHRIVTECISGSVAAAARPQFAKLLDRLEPGDVLIVTKLDRLGRGAMDVRATIDRLEAAGVRVYCLQLGGADLTSAAGKMTMGVLGAVAEFERDLLIERTNAGIARAVKEGKKLGRPTTLTKQQKGEILEAQFAGVSVSQLARDYKTSRQTIMRVIEHANDDLDVTAPAI